MAIISSSLRIQGATWFKSLFSDQNFYLFIGKALPWDDEDAPDAQADCLGEIVDAYTDMQSAKKIVTTDVSFVVPRADWTIGTVYTQYSQKEDLTIASTSFFVITSQLNVYKCISNNSGAESTIQPTGTSTSVVTLSDGYRWKYMYTVSSTDVMKFVTSEWIPVKTLVSNDGSDQWTVQQAAISGTIDRIDILTAGTQYESAPTVTILGDGTGATAEATVEDGSIVAITMTDLGSDYSYASVELSGGGTFAGGATLEAIVSPKFGHGYDAVTELGGFYVLINSKLIYDESENFTVNNDFRKIGIWQNPKLNDGTTLATENLYNQTLRLTLSTIVGTEFAPDELVEGSVSGATGYVLDWVSPLLRLVQINGTFLPGETITGENITAVLETFSDTAVSATSSTIVLSSSASGTNDFYNGQTIYISAGTGSEQTRIISDYVGLTKTATISVNWTTNPDNTSEFSIADITLPDLQKLSGEIVYLENRRAIVRSSITVEDLKITIGF